MLIDQLDHVIVLPSLFELTCAGKNRSIESVRLCVLIEVTVCRLLKVKPLWKNLTSDYRTLDQVEPSTGGRQYSTCILPKSSMTQVQARQKSKNLHGTNPYSPCEGLLKRHCPGGVYLCAESLCRVTASNGGVLESLRQDESGLTFLRQLFVVSLMLAFTGNGLNTIDSLEHSCCPVELAASSRRTQIQQTSEKPVNTFGRAYKIYNWRGQ